MSTSGVHASFVAVAAGNGYTCALRNDSVVQCWGLNDFGQAPPAWTGTSGPFTAVAVGSRTCGLTAVGIIECIGSTPITLTASSGSFVKVMVGSVAICGLRTDGVVQCHSPLPSGFVFPDGTFIDYDVDLASPSAVGAYTCGVRPDGTVACFGDNTDGRAPATRTAATGSFTRVATGWYHACALRTDGRFECWGNPFAAAVDHVLPTATFSAPASVIVGQDIALSLSGAQVPGIRRPPRSPMPSTAAAVSAPHPASRRPAAPRALPVPLPCGGGSSTRTWTGPRTPRR